ncbi:MAG: hypothetical protein DDT22_00252 [candidate division WS2 bacterium]|nr:hypothetical protein [Candidatus Lithacetigena glycinireducens]
MRWLKQNSLFLSLPVDRLLALTAYGEAASEGAEGMMAVINVIVNRLRNPRAFADKTILSTTNNLWFAVILKPWQFSVFNLNDSMRPKLERLARTFDNSIAVNPVLNQAYRLAQMGVSGFLADNTKGATHYHTTAVSPPWSRTIERVGQIRRHIFYSAYPLWARIRKVGVSAPSYTAYILLALALTGIFILSKKGR